MQTSSPLTKKQSRNLNRRFGLGVYRKRTISDYPLLHTYLTHVLGGAHDQLLMGTSVKLTLGQPWILDAPHSHVAVPKKFWREKIGAYRIGDCTAYCDHLHLNLHLPDKKDTFYPDDFVIATSPAICQFYVSCKGKLEYVDLTLNTKPPQFIRELARDFPMGGPCARKKLRQQIRGIGEEQDETFLATAKFGRAVTIQL